MVVFSHLFMVCISSVSCALVDKVIQGDDSNALQWTAPLLNSMSKAVPKKYFSLDRHHADAG